MNAPPFPHLPVETLVALSLSGEWDPHVEECAFCREQLEFLRSVERDLAATEGEVSAAPFRLAAASIDPSKPLIVELERGSNSEVVVRTKVNKGLFLWKKIMSKKKMYNR